MNGGCSPRLHLDSAHDCAELGGPCGGEGTVQPPAQHVRLDAFVDGAEGEIKDRQRYLVNTLKGQRLNIFAVFQLETLTCR